MFNGKRKANEIYDNYNNSEISTTIDEIKNLLIEKNIFNSENIDKENKDIKIELIDKNNIVIGLINGGVGEFTIIENGSPIEKNAFSISWLKLEDKYQGYNLGTFLIIYCIYLCKINFNDIEYIVLDDDSDERNIDKNIYYKLGFTYQETKEIQLENGKIITINSGPEMQINIKDFLNKNLLEKLNKIKIRLRNIVKYQGGKKSKKYKKYRKNKKSSKNKKYIK